MWRSRLTPSSRPALSTCLSLADAGEDVVQLFVLRARVADAVGGDERQPFAPRIGDEHLVAVLFLADAMPLQLDVRSSC